MRIPSVLVSLGLVLAACGGSSSQSPSAAKASAPDDAAFRFSDEDELSQEIAGVTCPGGATAEVCSGPGNVYTALLRVGQSATSFAEVAQELTVSRVGLPGRVRIGARLLRPVSAGETPELTVALREIVGGVIPTAASDLARAALDASALSRQLPSSVEVPFTTMTPAAPVQLDPAKTYALVLTVEAPSAVLVHLGLSSHKSNAYAAGRALRRTGGGTPASSSAAWVAVPDADLSFSLTLGDGVDVDECATGLDDCDANATCTNADPGWTCACNAGFSGDGVACHLPSCKAWFDAGETGNGVHTIDPDGNGVLAPADVWCDMTNGGWTRIYGELAVPHATYTATKTNAALAPEALLNETITAGVVAHLSQAHVNAIPAVLVEDRLDTTALYYGRFNRGTGSFDFVTRTSTAGNPPGLVFNYRWGNGQSSTSWALNPDDVLYSGIGGSGLGYFGGYGVRLAGSHACGTYANNPSDLVRSEHKNGDYNNGCYQPLGYWRTQRTIWLK